MTKVTRERPKATVKQKEKMKKAAKMLIVKLGGLTKASRILGVEYYTLNGWRTRGRIPTMQAERIAQIPEAIKHGFTLERMRPDLVE